MWKTIMIKLPKTLLTLTLASLLTACGSHPIYTMGAKVMENFSESVATPHILELSDVDVTCRFGSNMSPLFGTFNSLTDTGQETLSLLYLLSANCSEQAALAAELRSIRALQNGLVNEAKDARTEQKRWLKLTADRRKKTFESAMAAYKYDYTDSEAKCPKLKQPQDELVFLLGLLTGLQAILADSGAELAAGVPRNIAPAAVRASYCLDDDAWWGLALRHSRRHLDSAPRPHAFPGPEYLGAAERQQCQVPGLWCAYPHRPAGHHGGNRRQRGGTGPCPGPGRFQLPAQARVCTG